jgi:hypothetical protein
VEVPDITQYRLHRTVDDVPVWGVAVPGLCARFLRHRDEDGRTAGIYAYGGRDVFVAWGRAPVRHCDWHAFVDPGGRWEAPRRGCPRVRAVREGDRVTGVAATHPQRKPPADRSSAGLARRPFGPLSRRRAPDGHEGGSRERQREQRRGEVQRRRQDRHEPDHRHG